jgi:two-component system chemotaxis response regulator CheY
MIKILIVDDNQNNRMLIRALVEDYCEDNDKMVLISEATNGLEAALLAEDEKFEIIFMDIMMPQTDGIEATQRIRSFDSKAMIVAVSAVDDGERQKQILSCGAEDYISKPINADIFSARLGNYFSLIESRNNPKPHLNPDAANVFSRDVFSRKVIFYIQNEDDLAEFWEYYLLDSDLGSEALSGCVRALYAVGGVILKLGFKMQMIVEESTGLYYMTMTEADKINSKILQLIMLKNPEVKEYKIEGNKLSLLVSKPVRMAPVTIVNPIVVPNSAPVVDSGVISSFAPLEYVAAAQTLQVYDFMEDEDFNDLQEYVGKLNSIMLIIGGGVELDEVDEIASALQSIGRVASGYTDSYIIGQALSGLGAVIASHEGVLVEKSSALAPLCAAFGRDLESWMAQTFTTGAPSVDYMNDTIVANARMIESFLTMDDNVSSDAEMDDIFDF